MHLQRLKGGQHASNGVVYNVDDGLHPPPYHSAMQLGSTGPYHPTGTFRADGTYDPSPYQYPLDSQYQQSPYDNGAEGTYDNEKIAYPGYAENQGYEASYEEETYPAAQYDTTDEKNAQLYTEQDDLRSESKYSVGKSMLGPESIYGVMKSRVGSEFNYNPSRPVFGSEYNFNASRRDLRRGSMYSLRRPMYGSQYNLGYHPYNLGYNNAFETTPSFYPLRASMRNQDFLMNVPRMKRLVCLFVSYRDVIFSIIQIVFL